MGICFSNETISDSLEDYYRNNPLGARELIGPNFESYDHWKTNTSNINNFLQLHHHSIIGQNYAGVCDLFRMSGFKVSLYDFKPDELRVVIDKKPIPKHIFVGIDVDGIIRSAYADQ